MDINAVWAIDVSARLQKVIESAKRELWIISPYTKTDDGRGNGSDLIVRSLHGALKRNVRVNMVMRNDEPGTHSRVPPDLEELVDSNMRLFEMENLHAKLYLSEASALVTSLNLYAPTRSKTLDLGIHVTGGPLLAQLREFLEGQLKPHLTPVNGARKGRKSTGPERAAKGMGSRSWRRERPVPMGNCIRCGDPVGLDTSKPYCGGCLKSWLRYKNEDYEETYCHECGEDWDVTSMRKPRCRDCWEENPNL